MFERIRRWARSRLGVAPAGAFDQRLADVIGSLTDPFVMFDHRFRFTFVNDVAVAVLRKSREELIGRDVWAAFPEAVHTVSYVQLGHAMKERVPVEYETFHPPFRRWFFAKAYPTSDGGLALFFRDVTDRKTKEEALRESQSAERAARAEAERASAFKDEFLATLSHELRTPMNAILGWVRVLEKRPDDTTLAHEGIQVIARNAKAQSDLIADLLDMSRIISGKIRLEVATVDLSRVIGAAAATMRPAADAKHIRIDLLLDPNADTIRGDAGRIQQVVTNLLSNAVKFTPKDGRIEIALSKSGSQSEIAVRDSGVGIAPAFLPYVFDRFRQGDASTTREHGGLGLGLAIVKQLVELHGGTVRVDSQGTGRGTTFTVALPVALMHAVDDDASPASPDRSIAGDVDLDGVTVLAVEDQKDARELLRLLLERSHARVFTAASVDEALHVLDRAHPDVILCDIGMPGKDGYAFIAELRRRHDVTPALAVTAFARTEDKVRALRAGFHAHVAKPIEPDELLSTLAVFARGAKH